jgi:glycerol-3-phosphate dehydrogenase
VSAPWSLAERREALRSASREGVDLLVVGGGITGAGVLRDAASRGLGALLLERVDFAAGTSSRSSKMIHGGLRYIGEGQLGMTHQACRERDLLVRLNPHLVRSVNFRKSSRFRMVGRDEVAAFCPDLRREGLRGAGLYWDAQVDDARLVLESLKSARTLGAEAVNHAEVVGFERDLSGRIGAVQVRDALGGETLRIPAHAVVNATGPGLERVRGLDRPVLERALQPAKGVHLVIPRERIAACGAVTFEAQDGRHLFLLPWDNVAIIGTTDAWSSEIDEPVVTIEEVHYLLAAANEAFPRAALTTNDLRCVFAGVRPLAAEPDEEKPSSSVSREHRIYEDPSGLVSAAGGKLTTYRATGQEIVDRLLERLPAERRAAAGPSRTETLPLREDDFERAELEAHLASRFAIEPERAEYLVRTWGCDAERLLDEAPPELRKPIGRSRFTYAEIPWSLRTECPATLCDLLERRLRLAIFAVGQGIAELDTIAGVAAEAAGWDPERRRAEAEAYLEAVRLRYQIRIPQPAGVPRRRPAAA